MFLTITVLWKLFIPLQIFLFIENKRIPNLAQTVISHIHQIQIFNLRHTVMAAVMLGEWNQSAFVFHWTLKGFNRCAIRLNTLVKRAIQAPMKIYFLTRFTRLWLLRSWWYQRVSVRSDNWNGEMREPSNQRGVTSSNTGLEPKLNN